jgi:hypothetical protein
MYHADNQFIRVTDQKFESITALHRSPVFFLSARTAKPRSNLLALVNRAFLLAGDKTATEARLHEVRIGFPVVPRLIHGKYMASSPI